MHRPPKNGTASKANLQPCLKCASLDFQEDFHISELGKVDGKNACFC